MSLFEPPLSHQLILDWYHQSQDDPDFQYEQKRDKAEHKLLTMLNVCPVTSGVYEDANLKLEAEKVEEFLFDDYYDTNKLQQLDCALKSIFMPAVGHVAVVQRIKDWIRDPKLIGTPSKRGFAMLTDFTEINDLMVLKAPRKADKDLNHEYFVGTVLNNLRKKIPNFALILGGFKCSPPFFEKKQLESWCLIDDAKISVQYLLYENITPSENIIDLLPNIKFNEFLPYLLQIAFALQEAEVYEFSHNDLHLENVMIRKNNTEKRWIMYHYKNKPVYIKADKIATFIDFGEANISVGGEKFGTVGNEKIGVYRDKANPVRDFFRFFSSVALEAYRAGNKSFYQQAERFLVLFFSDFQGYKDLVDYENVWFTLPPPDYFARYPKMANIIDLMNDAYPKSFIFYVHDSVPNTERIMSCEVEGNCALPDEAYQYFGLANWNPAKDLYTLYDMFRKSTTDDSIVELINDFSSEAKELIVAASAKRIQIQNKIIKLYSKLRRITLGNRNFDTFINSLRKIDRYLRQIVQIYDLVQEHQRLTEVLALAESIYSTGRFKNKSFNYEVYLHSEVEDVRILIEDIRYILEKQTPTKLSKEEKQSIDQIYLLIEILNLI